MQHNVNTIEKFFYFWKKRLNIFFDPYYSAYINFVRLMSDNNSINKHIFICTSNHTYM